MAAVSAAHLSSTEHNKPTIFEIWAQESLFDTLQPAFKIICQTLSSKYENCGWLAKWHEELFLVLNGLIQSHCLYNCSASFSESFYGLKRWSINSQQPCLTNKDILLSLVDLVGIPYSNEKLTYVLDYLQHNRERFGRKNYHYLIVLLNNFFVIVKCIKLYYNVCYLAGITKFHSVVHNVSGIELVCDSSINPENNSIANTKSILSFNFIFKCLSTVLEFSAFSIQFLNWWANSESRNQLYTLPIPRPLDLNNTLNNLCPICHQNRKIDVVLQTSGYVFCYSCIKTHLENKKVCPVTNLPSTTENLVRLYTENNK